MSKAQATAAATAMERKPASVSGTLSSAHIPADTSLTNNGASISPDVKEPDSGEDSHGKIQGIAYQLWLERGCPECSAETDWEDAEKMFRASGQ